MHAPRSSEIAQLTLVECSQKDLYVYSVSMLLAGMAENAAHGGIVLSVGFVYKLKKEGVQGIGLHWLASDRR